MIKHLFVGRSLDSSGRHDAVADIPDGDSVVIGSGDIQRLALVVCKSRSQDLAFVSAKSAGALILAIVFLSDISSILTEQTMVYSP
jgi:hypothetical protein